MMNPYEKLAALRAELAGLNAEIAICDIGDIIELSDRAKEVRERVAFWEEKIADWNSD